MSNTSAGRSKWPYVPLTTVAEKIQDGTHFSPLSTSGPFRYVTSRNIRPGYLDLESCGWISEREHKAIFRRCDPRYGDILLTKDGANTGNASINTLHEEISLLSSVAMIRTDPTVADGHFVLQYLLSPEGQTRLTDLVSGNAITRLTLAKIKAFSIPSAPLPEQRAIAAVLDSLDDAIQKTEQIIAKLQQVKQGLLHDLLTRGIDDNGELRDPERHPEQFQDSPLGRIPKGWEVEKLRVLYSEPSRNGLYKGPAYHGRGAPMIQMGNLFASDEVSFSDTGRVSVSESELRTFGLRVGDILFARRSLVFEGAGRAAVVGVVPEPATFESSIVRVRLRTERILPRFAVTYLASHQGYLRRRAHIRQVAVSGVSGTDIASFLMAIPTLSEQQTIVETKAILDLQIENEARARGALMSMKNGLADDLLTGRVRTTSLPEFSA